MVNNYLWLIIYKNIKLKIFQAQTQHYYEEHKIIDLLSLLVVGYMQPVQIVEKHLTIISVKLLLLLSDIKKKIHLSQTNYINAIYEIFNIKIQN